LSDLEAFKQLFLIHTSKIILCIS